MTLRVTRRDALISTFGAAATASLPGIKAQEQQPSTTQASAVAPATAAQLAGPPVCLADYEVLAHEKLSHVAWEYYNSAAADENTVRWNREALAKVRLKPRVLIDVSQIDTRTKLLGEEMPHPILLAPTSSHMLAHPEGEVATARGAGAAGAIMVASTVSNRSIEDVVHAATRPVWFQLYVADDRGVTKALIQRAEAAGTRALCITVDNTAHYARNREERIQAGAPQFPFPNINVASAGPGGRGGRAPGGRKFTWKDLEWVQSFAKTPILLKGVVNPDDANHAAKAGVAGIVVSNHGGRALDGVPATIEALPVVADKVSGRIPILMDGGIRRGGDVLKALANGASAVLVGRPYLYGLGVAGSDGVRHVIEILRTEFEAAMALTGRTSIGAIDRSVLWPAQQV